jgi:hypothetical protein
MSYAEVLLVSTVLYAGSAQFVVTSMLTLASPAAAIVLTVFFLNLRHLLLSAALAPALRHVPAADHDHLAAGQHEAGEVGMRIGHWSIVPFPDVAAVTRFEG